MICYKSCRRVVMSFDWVHVMRSIDSLIVVSASLLFSIPPSSLALLSFLWDICGIFAGDILPYPASSETWWPPRRALRSRTPLPSTTLLPPSAATWTTAPPTRTSSRFVMGEGCTGEVGGGDAQTTKLWLAFAVLTTSKAPINHFSSRRLTKHGPLLVATGGTTGLSCTPALRRPRLLSAIPHIPPLTPAHR